MRTLTVYSKPDCHLCEEALKVVRKVCAELLVETGMRAKGECLPASVELQVLDITTEDALHRAYFERIPVVDLDGEELFEFFVDAEVLRERLRRAPL